MEIPDVPQINPELADYDPQVQRLVQQMQGQMKKIWQGQRGVHRQNKIKEFNVQIANVIEWRAHRYKLQLETAIELIEKLRGNIEKVMNDKWEVRDERDEALRLNGVLQEENRELKSKHEQLLEDLDDNPE